MKQELEQAKHYGEDHLVEAFLKDEQGVGVVEIVLILVVLIALVLLFKNQLNSLMKTILDNVKNDALNI